ncbi:hypothetical protein TRFO_08371 [Tritrichomonas foetus]|uniref:Endoplasmic reticulum-Golgi intermediate compartment protein 3 n=1 Tax=Tritrichomonas foetus TaxID=1144522 RepID=A0A1J4JQD2_9EUKA|nr:hypothetical protein TRFO_08371 [Tritrichomonas foetus]|eukprot:OHS99444.1 hypothetical protein TRFO_08371 [Tritrichomonas foetus]
MSETLFKFLRQIDIFDKFENNDLKISTRSSFFLSLFLSTFGCLFFIIKIVRFMIPNVHRDLALNQNLINEEDFVNISIAILVNLPCYFLHLDAIDTLGFSQLDINSTANLRRLDSNGRFIGIVNETLHHECLPCHGILPAGTCCNSCEQLILLATLKGIKPKPEEWVQCNKNKGPNAPHVSINEKCLVKGKISVNKVAGNFHIAPGRNDVSSGSHQHDMSFRFPNMDLSHEIRMVRFGPFIPTISNPLQGMKIIQNPNTPMVYKYHLLATPVIYIRDGKLISRSYEYTALQMNRIARRDAPGIFFHYSFTPYTVTVVVKSRSFAQFLTSTFGFLSGSFAMASMLDLFIDKRKRIFAMIFGERPEKKEGEKE